jgi:hypothetical protein
MRDQRINVRDRDGINPMNETADRKITPQTHSCSAVPLNDVVVGESMEVASVSAGPRPGGSDPVDRASSENVAVCGQPAQGHDAPGSSVWDPEHAAVPFSHLATSPEKKVLAAVSLHAPKSGGDMVGEGLPTSSAMAPDGGETKRTSLPFSSVGDPLPTVHATPLAIAAPLNFTSATSTTILGATTGTTAGAAVVPVPLAVPEVVTHVARPLSPGRRASLAAVGLIHMAVGSQAPSPAPVTGPILGTGSGPVPGAARPESSGALRSTASASAASTTSTDPHRKEAGRTSAWGIAAGSIPVGSPLLSHGLFGVPRAVDRAGPGTPRVVFADPGSSFSHSRSSSSSSSSFGAAAPDGSLRVPSFGTVGASRAEPPAPVPGKATIPRESKGEAPWTAAAPAVTTATPASVPTLSSVRTSTTPPPFPVSDLAPPQAPLPTPTITPPPAEGIATSDPTSSSATKTASTGPAPTTLAFASAAPTGTGVSAGSGAGRERESDLREGDTPLDALFRGNPAPLRDRLLRTAWNWLSPEHDVYEASEYSFKRAMAQCLDGDPHFDDRHDIRFSEYSVGHGVGSGRIDLLLHRNMRHSRHAGTDTTVIIELKYVPVTATMAFSELDTPAKRVQWVRQIMSMTPSELEHVGIRQLEEKSTRGGGTYGRGTAPSSGPGSGPLGSGGSGAWGGTPGGPGPSVAGGGWRGRPPSAATVGWPGAVGASTPAPLVGGPGGPGRSGASGWGPDGSATSGGVHRVDVSGLTIGRYTRDVHSGRQGQGYYERMRAHKDVWVTPSALALKEQRSSPRPLVVHVMTLTHLCDNVFSSVTTHTIR